MYVAKNVDEYGPMLKASNVIPANRKIEHATEHSMPSASVYSIHALSINM